MTQDFALAHIPEGMDMSMPGTANLLERLQENELDRKSHLSKKK